jgi:hypothetical protein
MITYVYIEFPLRFLSFTLALPCTRNVLAYPATAFNNRIERGLGLSVRPLSVSVVGHDSLPQDLITSQTALRHV